MEGKVCPPGGSEEKLSVGHRFCLGMPVVTLLKQSTKRWDLLISLDLFGPNEPRLSQHFVSHETNNQSPPALHIILPSTAISTLSPPPTSQDAAKHKWNVQQVNNKNQIETSKVVSLPIKDGLSALVRSGNSLLLK